LEPVLLEKFPVAAGTDMLTSCGLAARCAVTLGGDTGLLHMATAAGGRVIELEHKGASHYPYGHRDWVLEPKPPGLLVADIEVGDVLAEIRRAIGA